MLITFKLTDFSRSCSKADNTFKYLNKVADGESLGLYLKSVFNKIPFWKKTEKRNEIKFWTSELATLEINAENGNIFSDTA